MDSNSSSDWVVFAPVSFADFVGSAVAVSAECATDDDVSTPESPSGMMTLALPLRCLFKRPGEPLVVLLNDCSSSPLSSDDDMAPLSSNEFWFSRTVSFDEAVSTTGG
jgi:hypothetical protein